MLRMILENGGLEKRGEVARRAGTTLFRISAHPARSALALMLASKRTSAILLQRYPS